MKANNDHEWMEHIKGQLAHFVGPRDGFFGIKPVALKPAGGAELAIFFQDKSPRMRKLVRKEMLGLGTKHGVWNNMFGPVGWILTFVYEAHDPDTPILSAISCINPHREEGFVRWRRLANQADWYLLMFAGKRTCKYMDYDNSSDQFNLRKGLSMIAQDGALTPMVDTVKAEALFRRQFSPRDLLKLPVGHSSQHFS